jgi:hypothetical protein
MSKLTTTTAETLQFTWLTTRALDGHRAVPTTEAVFHRRAILSAAAAATTVLAI